MKHKVRRRHLVGLLSIFTVALLVIVALRINNHTPQEAEIMYADDFDGVANQIPNPSKWSEWSGCTYNNSAYYGNIKCGQRATLDGQGHLVVPATPEVGTAISTGGKFAFVYGEASAWIKMPSAVGYWPAFWMLNADPSGKTERPNGEIDVLETYTTFPSVYHRGIHNWNSGGFDWSSPDDPRCGNVDLSAAFHKYSVRVEPGHIAFFFDGVQCGDVLTKEDGEGKPYQFGPENMNGNWLILTLAIGGADGQQKPAVEAAGMLVDRVEVTQL